MHFRLALTVRDLSMRPEGVHPLVLEVPGEPPIRVTLTDRNDGANLDCVAELVIEPPRKTREALESLERGVLPAGHPPRDEWGRDFDFIDEKGVVAENYAVPLSLMPAGVQQFVTSVDTKLRAAARQVIGVIRWRGGLLGLSNPFASKGFEWSDDGAVWHSMPYTGFIRVLESWRLEFTQQAVDEMQILVSETSEPLAHELFREAWGQQWNNPRSSFLLAMVALEVGIKEYIAACVPEATWLAQNAPSPPVVNLLRDYIPQLTPAAGTPVQVESGLLEEIKKAVPVRNQLAHVGAQVPANRLGKTLRAVRNILLALDGALGHTWAVTHQFASLEDDHDFGSKRI